jgi:hypothetical protein
MGAQTKDTLCTRLTTTNLNMKIRGRDKKMRRSFIWGKENNRSVGRNLAHK